MVFSLLEIGFVVVVVLFGCSGLEGGKTGGRGLGFFSDYICMWVSCY